MQRIHDVERILPEGIVLINGIQRGAHLLQGACIATQVKRWRFPKFEGDAFIRAISGQGEGARLRRVPLAFPGAEAPRFADVTLTPREAGGWWLEAHPVDEFPGDDPAQLLPSALSAALKGLAHELRNPLAGLKGAAQLLERRIVGPLVAKLETARLARTLGTLLKNGVPLLTALGIGGTVLGNRTLAEDVETAAGEVKNGVGLSTALGRGKRFPRLALQMIQVGEESGALDGMLLKTADTFEQETGLALDRMLAMLVPAVTLLLAAVIGIVIMAVLVPIYGLGNSIS